MARDVDEAFDIGRSKLALHGESRNAELHLRRDGRERRLGSGAAGGAVADDADVVSARGLTACDIEDVAEDAADRSPGDVHDPESFRIGHGQNQRSETATVSPGRIGDRSGSVLRVGTPWIFRVMVTLSFAARGVKPPAMAMAFSTVMFGTYGYWPGNVTSPSTKNGR